jgi:endoglucanase
MCPRHAQPALGRRRRIWILIAIVVVVAIAAASIAVVLTRSDKAKARGLYYVDATTKIVEQVKTWRKDGRKADAEKLEALATQPFARWFTGGTQDTRGEAETFTARAAVADQIPILVAYNIPFRDCGSFSAGGAASDADYRTFIDALAAGIGQRRALIVVEPDAVAQIAIGCVRSDLVQSRYEDLKYAISTLKRNAQATVYLDAGNPGWITDPAKIAGPLKLAGIASANGFSLNVSNFQTTASNITYGTALSADVGGSHFVIDTSRNGHGTYGSATDTKNWCNPPGRAPGIDPTNVTNTPLVDAYLWIKISGESDGTCHPGDPPAGTWWPDYALSLAQADAQDRGIS